MPESVKRNCTIVMQYLKRVRLVTSMQIGCRRSMNHIVTKSLMPWWEYFLRICQGMGLPPISIIGLGRVEVSSEMRVPWPPARITAFMDFLFYFEMAVPLQLPTCGATCPLAENLLVNSHYEPVKSEPLGDHRTTCVPH